MWFLALMLGIGLMIIAIYLMPGGREFLGGLFDGPKASKEPTPEQRQAAEAKIRELRSQGYYKWWWKPRQLRFETAVNLYPDATFTESSWTFFVETSDRIEIPGNGMKICWNEGCPVKWIDTTIYPEKIENPSSFDLVVIMVNGEPFEVLLKVR